MYSMTQNKKTSQPTFNRKVSREKDQYDNERDNARRSWKQKKKLNSNDSDQNTDDNHSSTSKNHNQLYGKNVDVLPSSSQTNLRHIRRKLLVLHGDRQSGELLLGRMKSLKRKLLKTRVYDDNEDLGRSRCNISNTQTNNCNGGHNCSMIELVAMDAPFPWKSDASIHSDHNSTQEGEEEGDLLRTWWHRNGNEYVGLDESLYMVHDLWRKTNSRCHAGGNQEYDDKSEDGKFEGILGFSRGARLTHLIALLHQGSNGKLFSGLKYIIMASGYGDVPLPTNFPPRRFLNDLLDPLSTAETKPPLSIASLHIMGIKDRLIPIESSRSLLSCYSNPTVHEHDGGHHVPMRAADTRAILQFIDFIPSNPTDCLRQNRCPKPQPLPTEREEGGKNVSNKSCLSPTSDALTTTHDTTNPAMESKTEPLPMKMYKKSNTIAEPKILQDSTEFSIVPDEEHMQYHIDECESMAMIFPDEFQLLSGRKHSNGEITTDMNDNTNEDERPNYIHPIIYTIELKPEETEEKSSLWPPKPIAIRIEYPPTYPDDPPLISAQHKMNLLEFKMSQSREFVNTLNSVAIAEQGMPCVMSCVFAAREFFEGGGFASADLILGETNNVGLGGNESSVGQGDYCSKVDQISDTDAFSFGSQNCNIGERMTISGLMKECSEKRIERCKLEGMELAYRLVRGNALDDEEKGSDSFTTVVKSDVVEDKGGESRKGGSWKYTIGLVGKPSAGKSTFFNTATGFARQRGGSNMSGDRQVSSITEAGKSIGGATMAPHPFTTIDPNVGYCLVPAPAGSCPEDDYGVGPLSEHIGCTHGRDSYGRRLLPVMLKDIAGLVPGAYQGRGKGNKFLDDLTDGDALIHVMDASGTADAEGNTLGIDEDHNTGAGSHPLNDLAWVHNELIQWIFLNLKSKWDTIARKGRKKLADMFSGYKQSQALIWDVLLSVEKFLEKTEGRDHALDNLDTWDEGDVYRLVLTFLGSRFPMALALNKSDLPTAKKHCTEVLSSLPLHGAYIGTIMSARQEMSFVRHHIYSTLAPDVEIDLHKNDFSDDMAIPHGVWECLQSTLKLRKPVLVFPVSDMTTYKPLPGMRTVGVSDSSLPNAGMIACLKAANGEAPTLWDDEKKIYTPFPNENETSALRDVLAMKPGSTVEDVFNALKWIGAIGGEYVRAEGASSIGGKPKLVKKDDLIEKNNRILKIMTTKRREWQTGG